MPEAEPQVTGPEREPERWGRLYALVLGVLALEIAALWMLGQVFR
jgi:hypothetical protein